MFSLCTFLIGIVLCLYAALYDGKTIDTDNIDSTIIMNKLIALESKPGTLSRHEKAMALKQLDYSFGEKVRQGNRDITRFVAGFFLLIGLISLCATLVKAFKKSYHRSGLVKYG